MSIMTCVTRNGTNDLIGLGLWSGEYQGFNRLWLRWYDATENWVPTEAELAQQRATVAEKRAEELARRLRELGIEP